jgi:hypothetical protein
MKNNILFQGIKGLYEEWYLISGYKRTLWRMISYFRVWKVFMKNDILFQGIKGIYEEWYVISGYKRSLWRIIS